MNVLRSHCREHITNAYFIRQKVLACLILEFCSPFNHAMRENESWLAALLQHIHKLLKAFKQLKAIYCVIFWYTAETHRQLCRIEFSAWSHCRYIYRFRYPKSIWKMLFHVSCLNWAHLGKSDASIFPEIFVRCHQLRKIFDDF